MAKSTAQKGSFCFAEYVEDEETCHISLSGENSAIFNVQIPMIQVSGIIDNLLRIQERQRQKLQSLTVKQADQIEAMEQKLRRFPAPVQWAGPPLSAEEVAEVIADEDDLGGNSFHAAAEAIQTEIGESCGQRN